jgi:glycosyltransferase involved in cell wall biosynthesis
MPPKIILVVTDNLRTQINGVVTTFKNIESHAMADGFRIVYLDPGQFAHCDAPGYPEVKLSWPRGLGKKIKEVNPDHIHIATEGPLGFFTRIWCDLNGYRYNTSYHTKFPDYMKKIYKIPLWLTYAYMRWFHKHSGRVLTTTQTLVDDLRAHGFRGYITDWTRGVDRDVLKPTHTWRHPTTPITILYVGRVSQEKNLDDICCLEDDYRVEIVGDGPYRKELERKYPNVIFLGYKSGQELADCYARADVFVFPSRTDTFGIVIIEALSLGTPVAAYPVPGPIDILEQGVTGHMSENLKESIEACLGLSRDRIEQASLKWTWTNCWEIFRNNLVRR